MTEDEWLACTDPSPMVRFLQWENPFGGELYSNRKSMLVACAFCRIVLPLMKTEWGRRAVELAERRADGEAGSDDVATMAREAVELDIVDEDLFYPAAEYVPYFTLRNSRDRGDPPLHISVVQGNGVAAVLGEDPFGPQAQRRICDVIREVMGNPFRPVALDPSWLTGTVTSLAQTIYEERAFVRMPELAEALEHAGCTNADFLEHCRSGRTHVRGCWVVDRLLGKK